MGPLVRQDHEPPQFFISLASFVFSFPSFFGSNIFMQFFCVFRIVVDIPGGTNPTRGRHQNSVDWLSFLCFLFQFYFWDPNKGIYWTFQSSLSPLPKNMHACTRVGQVHRILCLFWITSCCTRGCLSQILMVEWHGEWMAAAVTAVLNKQFIPDN